jgi:hypothetical protein
MNQTISSVKYLEEGMLQDLQLTARTIVFEFFISLINTLQFLDI